MSFQKPLRPRSGSSGVVVTHPRECGGQVARQGHCEVITFLQSDHLAQRRNQLLQQDLRLKQSRSDHLITPRTPFSLFHFTSSPRVVIC